MARLTLLAILVVWMSWSNQPLAAAMPQVWAVAMFFGVFGFLVLGFRAWAVLAARRSGTGYARGLFRVQRAMHFGRLFIPVWLGVGTYLLDWGLLVRLTCSGIYAWPHPQLHVDFPQLMLGTLPAILAWVGLWWADFPIELALREQSTLANLEDDLPVHRPPTFSQIFGSNFRSQILFTLAPVLALWVLRDMVIAGAAGLHIRQTHGFEDIIMIPATILVLLFAPELLRRTLHTERLPDSPLRQRLEEMCRGVGLKYRDILLWRTGDTMGNAAVMGMLPRVRYVLLTDLLLETMTDEQIEAVFAHELGHVVHKHLMWFAAFFALTIAFMGGPGQFGLDHLHAWYISHWSAGSWDQIEGLLDGAISFGAFVLAFGYLSPKFERQADVYAARSVHRENVDEKSFVTERGAALIASALNRVAAINHIPVSARNWSHGSIATRVRAVCEMSGDPSRTRRFDRFMNRHYVGLIALILTFGVWTCLSMRSSVSTNPDANNARVVTPSPAAGVGR